MIAYVNADTTVSGVEFGGLSGTPGMLAVGRAVCERTPSISGLAGASNLWEEWNLRSKSPPDLGLPGSGSDFAVFLHHLSLPVLDFGFGGGHGGQYHTTFDDFAFVERYFDPGFKGHEAAGSFCAELLGGARAARRAELRRLRGSAHAGRRRARGGQGSRRPASPGSEPSARSSSPVPSRSSRPRWRTRPSARATSIPRWRCPKACPARSGTRTGSGRRSSRTATPRESLPTLRSAARKDAAALDAELDALVAAVRALIPERR